MKIVSTVLIIFSLAAFFIYNNAALIEVRGLLSEIDSLEESIEVTKQLEVEIDAKESLRQELQRRQGNRLAQMVPRGRDDARTMMTLDNIARDSGVSINGVSIESGDSFASQRFAGGGTVPYKVKTLRLQIEASYSNFTDFISNVERSIRLLDTVQISFSSREGGIYSFNVLMYAYWIE